MAMNTQLGYKPVTFDDLTQDEAFWKGVRVVSMWIYCTVQDGNTVSPNAL